MQNPLPHVAVPARRPPPRSIEELEIRAAALAERTVEELARGLAVPLPEDGRRAKGFVGQLVERALGADPTAGDRPDFPELGVELKTVPVDARGFPAESTFCCSIRMDAADRAEWQGSRLERRLRCVLFVPVATARTAPLAGRRFGAPRLWRPSGEELAALRADWEDLIGAIGSGRAPRAQEGRVLQVRPKGASGSDRAVAPSEDGAGAALPLGFYLRPAFTAGLLRRARA